ncbi:MAG: polymer-forming cytoskeletal protein [bacterium]|nr:polymer-forming cytoskeletal protein [bacterium]
MADDAVTVMPHVYDVFLEDGPSVAVGGATHEGQDFLINGRLDGGFVVVGRNVTVGRTGRVRANIHGESIVVEGEVEGDLHGGDQIVVRTSGVVTGKLVAPRVTLEKGSKFQGAVEMRAPQAPRPKAGL